MLSFASYVVTFKGLPMAEPRKLETKMSDETRIALLEQAINHMNDTLLRIEKRFDQIDQRFDKIDARIDGLAHEIKQNYKDINSRLWSNFLWTIGSMGALLALVAHALHWI